MDGVDGWRGWMAWMDGVGGWRGWMAWMDGVDGSYLRFPPPPPWGKRGGFGKRGERAAREFPPLKGKGGEKGGKCPRDFPPFRAFPQLPPGNGYFHGFPATKVGGGGEEGGKMAGGKEGEKMGKIGGKTTYCTYVIMVWDVIIVWDVIMVWDVMGGGG